MAIATISLPDEQLKWIKDNDKSLSKMVQRMIKKEINKDD